MDFVANGFEYLGRGGPVMVPIILDSLWMWVLIMERVFYFRRLNRSDMDIGEAVAFLRGRQSGRKIGSGLRAGILGHFLNTRTGNKELDQKILDQYEMREKSGLRRHLALVTVLAAVAPLFGLLGTVLGMMGTFSVIAVFGTGNARAMADGISEALITTQSGLLVAIPGLFMSVFLSRRADRIESGLNEFLMNLKRNV